MQYLLTCRLDAQGWENLPEAQQNALREGYRAFERELTASGRSIAGARWGARPTATTLGLKYGPAALSDGPFAGAQVVIDSCQTIECRDLEEAIAMARRLLILPLGGTVEVRPVEAATEQPADDP
jgi:hypothetical protein